MLIRYAIPLMILVALTSTSAQSKHRWHQPVQTADGQYLTPEALRMAEAQRYWPNVLLCDDGGYRIRPCDMGPGHR